MQFPFNRIFKVNGKEYRSLEEMPGDRRASFEKTAGNAGTGFGKEENKQSAIVFNGIAYDSIDDMPTYVRNLYEQARKTVEAGKSGNGQERGGRISRPGEPEPAFSVRSAVAAIVIVVLVLVLYYLFG